MNLPKLIKKSYVNWRGLRLNQKIVVIESDDWGSSRMHNKSALKVISRKVDLSKNPFANSDGLERRNDLEVLFGVLNSVKDVNQRAAVITALSLCGNPDFDQTNTDGNYHLQTLSDTYREYGEDDLLEFWLKEGVSENLLYPQFHGREHLHPERWMNAISDLRNPENLAFQNRSILGLESGDRNQEFLAAFEYRNEEDQRKIEMRTKDGLDRFENIFGFRSISFCPSQSIFGPHLHKTLIEGGVQFCQAGQHLEPRGEGLVERNLFWGAGSADGLKFWRRNCTFEPYKNHKVDHVNNCLAEIYLAFKFGKPAVINSHRINYTSRIRTDIRDSSLKGLERLLKEIIRKWPDVEFMNSAELANLMMRSSKVL